MMKNRAPALYSSLVYMSPSNPSKYHPSIDHPALEMPRRRDQFRLIKKAQNRLSTTLSPNLPEPPPHQGFLQPHVLEHGGEEDPHGDDGEDVDEAHELGHRGRRLSSQRGKGGGSKMRNGMACAFLGSTHVHQPPTPTHICIHTQGERTSGRFWSWRITTVFCAQGMQACSSRTNAKRGSPFGMRPVRSPVWCGLVGWLVGSLVVIYCVRASFRAANCQNYSQCAAFAMHAYIYTHRAGGGGRRWPASGRNGRP